MFVDHVSCDSESMKAKLGGKEALRELIAAELSRRVETMEVDSSRSGSLLAAEQYDSDEMCLTMCYDPDDIWNCLCSIHSSGSIKAVIDFVSSAHHSTL